MSETTFKTKAAVHRWLEENGWMISKTHFYDHCKDGLLRPSKTDGKYHLKAVKKYALLHVKKAETGERENDALTRQQEEERTLDIELKRLKKENAAWELGAKERKYMLTSDHIRHMAAAALALEQGLKHFFRLKSEEIVDLVEGDQKHSAALVRFLVAQLNLELTKFAKPMEFDIELAEGME